MTTKEIIKEVLAEIGPASADTIRRHGKFFSSSSVWPNERISSSAISRHLNAMLSDGQVTVEKRGSTKIWTLKPQQ